MALLFASHWKQQPIEHLKQLIFSVLRGKTNCLQLLALQLPARGSPHASASLQGDLNGKAPGLRGIALRCASVLRLGRERKVAKHSWTSDAASSLKQQGDLPPMLAPRCKLFKVFQKLPQVRELPQKTLTVQALMAPATHKDV